MKHYLPLALFLTSCASIMHGTHQDIGISSNPSGAAVMVDGQARGTTPLVLKLDRDSSHTVTVEQPGFSPYSATLTKSVSGWVVGNILAGGLIGLAVDGISGGIWDLSPENVAAELRKS